MRSRRTVHISRTLSELGRLKKAAEEAAKKKAGLDKAQEAKKDVDEAREDATISVERIDAIVAVLQPMVAAAERRAAAAVAEHQRDQKQTTSRLEAFGKAGVMPTAATAEKYAKVATDIQSMNDRAEKAMQGGKYRAAIATGDWAMVLQRRVRRSS